MVGEAWKQMGGAGSGEFTFSTANTKNKAQSDLEVEQGSRTLKAYP